MYHAIAFYVQPFVMSALMERLQNSLEVRYICGFPYVQREMIIQEYTQIAENLGKLTAGINVTGSFHRAKPIAQIATSQFCFCRLTIADNQINQT